MLLFCEILDSCEEQPSGKNQPLGDACMLPIFSRFLNEGLGGDEQPPGDASTVTRLMFLCVLGGF